jgi:glutathione S-transferase
MPRPKLTYFDFPGGRGEDCRIALHIAGVDFDDNRIKGSDWSQLKGETPFGALPVLEIEGHGELAQSNAILRFIGEGHDLHPSESWEAARHASVMAACEELRERFTPSLRMKDEDEKKAAREKIVAENLPVWAKGVESQISDGPFLAGEKLNVADIKVWNVVRWIATGKLDHVSPEVFASYPKLSALYESVGEHDGVKSWYAK